MALALVLLCSNGRALAVDNFKHPIEATAVYDPYSVLRIGTYAAYRFDVRPAFAKNATALPGGPPTRDERRRLSYHYSTAVADAVRDRITATLASGDGSLTEALRDRFNDDALLDEATGAIRVFGMKETDLADVTTALVIEAYNASHVVSLTARQGAGLSRAMRQTLLASPVLPTLDDAAKQKIITEMSYQIVLWESDASAYGYGRDDASLGRLRGTVIAAMAQLGLPLAQLRPTDDGLELVPKL